MSHVENELKERGYSLRGKGPINNESLTKEEAIRWYTKTYKKWPSHSLSEGRFSALNFIRSQWETPPGWSWSINSHNPEFYLCRRGKDFGFQAIYKDDFLKAKSSTKQTPAIQNPKLDIKQKPRYRFIRAGE